MFTSFSKTESVSLHLSDQKEVPSNIKTKLLTTGPTINEHIT